MQTAVLAARRKAGLTQAELARRAGVPRMYVVAIEGGRNVPLPIFEKVVTELRYLDLPLSHLEVAVTTEAEQKDDEEKLAELLEASEILKRLFYRFGGPILTAGDPRLEDVPPPDAKKIKELEALIDAIERGEEPTFEFHLRPRLRLVIEKKP
jgi:transcriptional regulator with XRE-family HTH domain